MTRIAPILALALAACGGTAGGPEAADGKAGLRVAAPAAARTAGLPDADGAVFGLEAASVHVEEIDLYLPVGTTCADLDAATLVDPVRCDVDKISVEGPFAVDLVAGTSSPSLAEIAIPALDYRRVDLELAPGPDGATLSVEGTTAAGDLFAVDLAFDEEARFEGMADFSADDAGSALVLLDPAGWFAASPVAACLASGDLVLDGGVMDLDRAEGACDDFADAFEDAVKTSGRLARDTDDDGVEDEADEVETETETEED